MANPSITIPETGSTARSCQNAKRRQPASDRSSMTRTGTRALLSHRIYAPGSRRMMPRRASNGTPVAADPAGEKLPRWRPPIVMIVSLGSAVARTRGSSGLKDPLAAGRPRRAEPQAQPSGEGAVRSAETPASAVRLPSGCTGSRLQSCLRAMHPQAGQHGQRESPGMYSADVLIGQTCAQLAARPKGARLSVNGQTVV